MRSVTDDADYRLEKKLQLVRQVRSRYSEDQYDLSNRERLLYGKTDLPGREAVSPYADAGYSDDWRYAEPEESPSSIKLRFLLAVLLFGAVVFLDQSHTPSGRITAEKIYSAISADYEDQLKDWVEAISGSVKP